MIASSAVPTLPTRHMANMFARLTAAGLHLKYNGYPAVIRRPTRWSASGVRRRHGHVHEVTRRDVVNTRIALEDNGVLGAIEGQQGAAELVRQIDTGLVRRGRVVGRRHHENRRQTGHLDLVLIA